MESKSTENLPIYAAIDKVLKPVGNAAKNDSDLPHVTHEGIFEIGHAKLRCYMLSNGMRIFDADDIDKFFQIT